MNGVNRRRVIRTCAAVGIGSIAGCEVNDTGSTEITRTEQDQNPVDNQSDSDRVNGWFETDSSRWYQAMYEYLLGLSQPWNANPTNWAHNYSEQLEHYAVDLIVPGVDGVVKPGPVGNMENLARASSDSFRLLTEIWSINQIVEYRSGWRNEAGLDTASGPIHDHYRRLDIDPNTNEPIYPLYRAISGPLYSVSEGEDGHQDALDTTLTILDVFKLTGFPSMPQVDDEIEEALTFNLRNYHAALRVLEAVLRYDLKEPSATEEASRLSFESGTVGDTEPPSPWYLKNAPSGSEKVYEISNGYASHGEKSMHIASYGDLREIQVAVDVDLSEVQTILYDGYAEANNPNWGDIKVNIGDETVSGRLVHDNPPEDQWYENVEIDASGFNGEQTVYFWVRGDPNDAYFDNFRFLREGGELVSPSEIVVSG